MFSIIEYVEKVCKEQGLRYLPVGESELQLVHVGHHGVFISHLLVDEQARTVEVRTMCPVTASPQRRSSVAELLNQVNAEVSIGNCSMDDDHGMIVHGVGIKFRDVTPDSDPIVRLLVCGSAVLDHHLPALIGIIFGQRPIRNASSTTAHSMREGIQQGDSIDPTQAPKKIKARPNRFWDQLGEGSN